MTTRCPDCNVALRHGKCPECDWRESSSDLPNRCGVCQQPSRIVQLTPGDDFVRRCASCHVTYLKRRASKLTDRCSECDKTVGEHEALIRQIVRAAVDSAERLRTKPRLVERVPAPRLEDEANIPF